jgi:HK97 family phage prohead protease
MTSTTSDQLHLRAFSPEVSHLDVKRDGVVEGLIVPYNQPTDVLEIINGELVEYREQFVPGAFDRAQRAASRVGLTFTHSDAMPDRMGYGLELRESAEGAVMTWQLYSYAREQAEELLTTTHRGLSVTFMSISPRGGSERAGQLVTRSAVHLSSVAATDNPAYATARVLALREDQEQLREQQQAEQARIREQVDTLLWLQGSGRTLSPVQTAYLEQHRALAS